MYELVRRILDKSKETGEDVLVARVARLQISGASRKKLWKDKRK